jgi:hypothetical protein
MERTHEDYGAHPRHPTLQIEVIAGDQRVAERRFDRQRTISIGRSLGNTLILADEHAPPSLDLFHRSRNGYALHFTDATHGSVVFAAGEVNHDLSELRARASPHRHGYDLDLEEGARGQVEVGDETVEFELVAGTDTQSVARDRWARVRGVGALALFAALGGLTLWVLTGDALRFSAAGARLTGGPPPRVASPPPAPTGAAVVTPADQPMVPTVIDIEKPLVLTAHIARPSPSRGPRPGVAPTGAAARVDGIRTLASIEVASPPRAPERSLGESDYTADGLLTPRAVLHQLGDQRGAIAAAYQEALRHRPDLTGDLVARITLNAEGRVVDVAIVRDTLGSPEVRREVDSALRRWRAPLPTAASATYEVPFSFRSIDESPPLAPR